MPEISFIPVLLGSDANVYGMARSFHEEYGVRSIAISKTIFTATVNSKIIDFVLEPDLENPEKFMKKLMEVANQHQDKKLVLVPCGDGYVKLVVKFQEQLKDYYLFNCLSEELLNTLSMKESFYHICEKYGFEYPKTEVVSFDDYQTKEVDIQFPVIIKASNSVEYWKCSFPGKMKVFVAQDKPEYERILNAIYGSTYKDHLTIQEFIPGDDSYMRVLNCYVGTDKKVKLMALGHALLEEHTPQGIGSYVAIINTYDEELLNKFKDFLEDIGYAGFANFDMKYDMRDGKYKLFENNIRQGRSSFFVTASGYNLAKWLVDDVVYHKDMPLTIAKDKHLWIQVPKGIVYKYVKDEACQKEVRELIKQGKCTNSLFYSKDLNLKRYIKLKINMLNHFRKYKKYYGKKGLAE
ncbi:ATP-grasp domain-containing protein [Paludicola sp. MB14-C6]|uniref:carboxylate--amine ligase n=1 Tax=Paludihabitans sp. MB14-C6 TaxID=3070656 RepID=UPI0027DAF8D9|nr:ATP-grasp domain-containing protein [Paludicola sp. MB14-C6]WMJ22220.1 ATP-grasp domain-containing protein [Paludicola sp. MB14-C6]